MGKNSKKNRRSKFLVSIHADKTKGPNRMFSEVSKASVYIGSKLGPNWQKANPEFVIKVKHLDSEMASESNNVKETIKFLERLSVYG